MKNKLSLLYKILIVIVSGIGIYLNILMAKEVQIIFYFTIISNIMCFIFYFVEVVLEIFKKTNHGRTFHLLKGGVIMCITLTLAIYQLVLANQGIYDGHMLECNFVHFFTPLLIILDYVVFSKKGYVEKTFPLIWSFAILAYGILCELYIILGGNFLNGSKYPYFFLNVEQYGVMTVVVNLLIIYFSFLLYGYLVYHFDRLVAEQEKEMVGR